jgi:bifunctional enzyme CysN/CysC
LSGSGKTTVARRLDHQLIESGRRAFLLDGDALRTGLTSDLGFGEADRSENLRRVTEVARLFAEAGVIALVSAIAPYEAARQHARERIGVDRFVLVHVATPIEVCEQRDAKGLYAKARAGQIPQFTGIDSPYEEPANPDVRLSPADGDPDAMAARIIEHLRARQLLSLS